MPFALVFIGLILVVTGVKNTHKQLGAQIISDFTGPNNFFYWFAAIGAVGALGASETFRPLSRAFMALIIIAMVIRNGGFFDQLMKAISAGPVKPADTNTVAENKAAETATTPSAVPSTSPLMGPLQSMWETLSQRATQVQTATNPGAAIGQFIAPKLLGLFGL